jgi:hypothetical protein
MGICGRFESVRLGIQAWVLRSRVDHKVKHLAYLPPRRSHSSRSVLLFIDRMKIEMEMCCCSREGWLRDMAEVRVRTLFPVGLACGHMIGAERRVNSRMAFPRQDYGEQGNSLPRHS